MEFSYDANGKRTHLVLPGGADHELQYASSDSEIGYLPPGNPGAYMRQFDGDRRVTGVTLPSGAQQSWTYDAFGRLLQIGSADATTSLAYAVGDPTRRFETMTRTASTVTQDLGFEYAGDLLTELSFGTTAVGHYTYEYDQSFRLTARNLSSGGDDAPYALSYDSDGLLTAFGGFTVSREVASALPTKLADGTAEHDLTFDAVGRLQTRAWAVNGTPVYVEQAQFLKFAASGAVRTACHYATLIVWVEVLGGPVVPGTLAGFCVGALVNYLIARRFVFASDRPPRCRAAALRAGGGHGRRA